MSKDPQEEYLDFEVAHEGWDKYELADKTIIRVRVVLVSMVKYGDRKYAAGTQNIVGVQRISKELKGAPSAEPPTMEDVVKATDLEDLEMKPLQSQPAWNVYRLSDGNTASISLSISQVNRSKVYNERGEPTYGLMASANVKLKKTEKK